MITLGTACSGIESASVALEPLGFTSQWFCEIEPFPSAVLAHHWPQVPNLNDMTALPGLIRCGLVPPVDVFVAGTPCQSFSVAGKRLSLNDKRGNLALTYVDVVNAIDEQRPGDECVAVWENVPGVLSTKDNAFGTFLAALVGDCDEADRPVTLEAQSGASRQKWPKSGYVHGPQRSAAWRTLDAQYFGVAQRRRRVFVVASARDGFDPGKVLFESEGVRRDIAPSREAREDVTYQTANCLRSCGVGTERIGDTRGADPVVAQPFEVANCLNARMHKGINSTINEGQTPVVHGTQDPCVADNQAHALGCNNGGENAVLCLNPEQPQVWRVYDEKGVGPALQSGEGRGNAVLSVSLRGREGGATAEVGGGDNPHVLAVHENQRAELRLSGVHGALNTQGGKPGQGYGAVLTDRVRRLTPVECERLQGFPDGWTDVPYRGKPAADGPRYKAIGNSKAVPVVRWIGSRIKQELGK